MMPERMGRPRQNRWHVGQKPAKWKVFDPVSGKLYAYCKTLDEAEAVARDFNGRYGLKLVIEER